MTPTGAAGISPPLDGEGFGGGVNVEGNRQCEALDAGASETIETKIESDASGFYPHL